MRNYLGKLFNVFRRKLTIMFESIVLFRIKYNQSKYDDIASLKNANVIMLCSWRVNIGHRHTYLHTIHPTTLVLVILPLLLCSW